MPEFDITIPDEVAALLGSDDREVAQELQRLVQHEINERAAAASGVEPKARRPSTSRPRADRRRH